MSTETVVNTASGALVAACQHMATARDELSRLWDGTRLSDVPSPDELRHLITMMKTATWGLTSVTSCLLAMASETSIRDNEQVDSIRLATTALAQAVKSLDGANTAFETARRHADQNRTETNHPND